MDWLAIAEEITKPPILEALPEFYEVAIRREPTALDRGHRIMDGIRSALTMFDTDTLQRSADQVLSHPLRED